MIREPTETESSTPGHDDDRPRALIVDADPVMLDACEQLLEQEGFLCLTAQSGTEAIALLDAHIDLVLCDAQIAKVNETSVLRYASGLQSRPALALMSAKPEARTPGLREDGFPVLHKPLDPSELSLTLAWLMHERHLTLRGLPSSDLAALYRIATAANSGSVSPQLLDRLLSITLATLDADSGAIMAASFGEQRPRLLSIVASRGLSFDGAQRPLEFGTAVAGWVAANARPLRLVGALDAYPQFKGLQSNPVRADALIAPLRFGREVLGTISVNSLTPNKFGPDKLAFLVSIAEVVAAALYRDRMSRVREHQDRLAVIGQLSASVAHELSNPLTVLMAGIEILDDVLVKSTAATARSLTERDELRHIVADARDAASRMLSLVSDLKGAARKPSSDEQEVDLTQVMKRAGQLVEPELKHRVEMLFETGPALPVRADPGRLVQVLVNLIVNASHAVGTGGRITLRSRRQAEWSIVEVEDNGPGIPAEVAARLFEPFFTTKATGTGLGLSISKQIALDYGGNLTFESVAGTGTRFLLSLPSASLTPRPDLPTVLLVDDEPMLLRATSRVLRSKFRVLPASSPQEALALSRSIRIDLILTDFSMPVHDGLWMIRALRALGITAPAALLTAVCDSEEVEMAVRGGLVVRVFSKPWDPATLATEAIALVDQPE